MTTGWEDEVPVLAFGIRYSDVTRRQQHVGILFRDSTGQLLLLHQPWHYNTLCEQPSDEYFSFVPLMFSRAERQMLAAQMKSFAESNPQGVPYAFTSPDEDCFGPERKWLLSDDGVGLTCATFIIAVFRTLGFELVATRTWKERPDDQKWFEGILAFMEYHPSVPDSHVQAVREQPRGCRFRPDDVVGSALSCRAPVDFETCVTNGKWVTARVAEGTEGIE